MPEALPEVGAAGPVDVGEVAHGWVFWCDWFVVEVGLLRLVGMMCRLGS